MEYIFKHALTQEVAYSSVLHERRKALHERTAQAIEALYQRQLGRALQRAGASLQRSGNTEKAVEYLHLAGQQAVQRSANAEAISHLTTALELLNTLPDTRERAQQELTLQLTLGVPLQLTRGFCRAGSGASLYPRPGAVPAGRGDSASSSRSSLGCGSFILVRGEFQTARELGEQLLGLAQQEQDPALLLGGAIGQLGQDLVPSGRVRRGPSAPGAGHYPV